MGAVSPLVPSMRGSVGLPHAGMLTDAVELRSDPSLLIFLRDNDRHWGTPRLTQAIHRAAEELHRERPGFPPLVVGDLSASSGGKLQGHRSHRTGRDADLLLFAMSPSGKRQVAQGFVHFGAFGLGVDRRSHRGVRFDVERQWIFLKALLQDKQAEVQWLFVSDWLEASMLRYALARGEDVDLVAKAESVMHQPRDSENHDDHVHMRLACSGEEALAGCQGFVPRWPWQSELPPVASWSDAELLSWILDEGPEPLEATP